MDEDTEDIWARREAVHYDDAGERFGTPTEMIAEIKRLRLVQAKTVAYLTAEDAVTHAGNRALAVIDKPDERGAAVTAMRAAASARNDAAIALHDALLAAPRADAGDQVGAAPTGGPAADEPGRCEVCGWTLAKSAEDGCVPGNCSYRPDEGSDEWYRIQRRRAALAAPTGGAGTGEGRDRC